MFTKWNRKIGLLIVAIIGVSILAIIGISTRAKAQQDVWYPNTENRASITTDKGVARQSFPKEFKLFNLNIEPLRQQLFSIVDSNGRQQSTVITLPNSDGNIEEFEVFEASNFEPDLQARFPDIRAFSGKGITDKYSMLKLSISPQGIQTMVFRTGTENEFIEPYSEDHTVYAVFRTHREKGQLPWECTTEEKNLVSDINSKLPTDVPESNAGQLKTMRLAQSCNGEYANFFGATSSAQVALVLAAYNATLTRANGTYEKDLAIHLNLIAATTNVIYYNPATDPYTAFNVGNGLDDWNAQLQATLTANIGEANYDIGHMFGRSGGGGNAGCIGCVCVDGQKGSGITSPADNIPMGDNFDIDFVVHEVGHQLGGTHTFSFQSEAGSPTQKEVGSGITIMGYAGITNQDVAPHSIDTFHETSIAQIQANMATKSCPVTTVMTVNHPPVVSPVSNVTIPISTPFALTGSATDPEGDPITYQWEQNDNSTTTGNNSVASPTKLTGPNWLSFAPTTSPTRTLPKLSTIQAGLFVTPTLPGGDAVANIEALSSVARTLNFRLTVRDNRPYVAGSTIGQTQFTDTTVTVTSTSGPFQVTAPNTGVTLTGGTFQNVTWNVSGTTGAPVSAANVKITLSTDSGNTFPVVLLASTPNDGSQAVLIPATSTTSARVKVEAVGNVFFDFSDTNFTISSPTAAQASLGGRVTAANGFPLSNVVMNLLNTNSSTTITIVTGTDGRYNFSSMNVGTGYVITPVLSGYSFNPANQYIPLTGERQDVDFVATVSTGQGLRAPFDFDGDGKTDVSVFRPSDGGWYTLQSSDQTIAARQFGLASDWLVPADYDGDGRTDLAVFRQGDWYILQSSTDTLRALKFGQGGDIPLPADYDGDAKSDLAVYRGGTWYILQSNGMALRAQQFGLSTDKPVMGDFDGDGLADLAVVRNDVWYILETMNGFRAQQFGQATDVLVPGDYDGDRRTDLAVFRNGVWMTTQSSNGILRGVPFGLGTDVPTQGDFDGDGVWDFAVWRPSDATSYVLQSTNLAVSVRQWGISSDKPLPSVYNQ